MLATAATLRVHRDWDVETTTTLIALRSLARRFRALSIEAKEHEKAMRAIVRGWRPDLLEEFGVAATMLCAPLPPAGSIPRPRSRCSPGVTPIPANSGQVTTRYRLNRYGDHQLNRDLHIIGQSRIRYDAPPGTT